MRSVFIFALIVSCAIAAQTSSRRHKHFSLRGQEASPQYDPVTHSDVEQYVKGRKVDTRDDNTNNAQNKRQCGLVKCHPLPESTKSIPRAKDADNGCSHVRCQAELHKCSAYGLNTKKIPATPTWAFGNRGPPQFYGADDTTWSLDSDFEPDECDGKTSHYSIRTTHHRDESKCMGKDNHVCGLGAHTGNMAQCECTTRVPQCEPSLTANCFTKKDGSVISCAGTTWFNENSDSCESCPEYATCQNGVVTMQTIRTIVWRSAKDKRTFHIPEQMKYDRCKISVEARQTDYGLNGHSPDSWDEKLTIRHHDVNVKLHNHCGFKEQCFNDLYKCNIDSDQEMVTIDHGPDDHITIEGENGKNTDYCPFNPKKDLSGKINFAVGEYGNEHVLDEAQTSGACGKYERSEDCYHMWAQVSIDCCCKGANCKCTKPKNK